MCGSEDALYLSQVFCVELIYHEAEEIEFMQAWLSARVWRLNSGTKHGLYVGTTLAKCEYGVP